MKSNINGPGNSQEAIARAKNSNKEANKGRKARDERNTIHSILANWAVIFRNSPVALLSILFCFAVGLEILFSSPMYLDTMNEMVGILSMSLSLTLGVFIALWAALVSHLMAKKLSRSMFNFEVFNEVNLAPNSIPHAAAIEKVQSAANKDFIKGLIHGFLLLMIVSAASWQRVWLQSTISGNNYGPLHRLLPVVCVALEIVSGVYVSYVLKRVYLSVKAYMLDKYFNRKMSKCAYEAEMSHEYYIHAQANVEKIPFNKDLFDTLYRYEHYSHDAGEQYVDEIPALKTLKVTVTEDGHLAEGIHLSADLQDGNHANSTWTNPEGEGVLTWIGNVSEVTAVYANRERHSGPFRENSSVKIDIRNRSIKAA